MLNEKLLIIIQKKEQYKKNDGSNVTAYVDKNEIVRNPESKGKDHR